MFENQGKWGILGDGGESVRKTRIWHVPCEGNKLWATHREARAEWREGVAITSE